MMPFLLLFAFLAYPLLELALLIKVGSSIGVLATLGLVVGSAVLGMAALRRQGLVVMRRAAATMREGRPPVEPVLEGALMALGGMLLIVPGLMSDAIGAGLLLPPVRKAAARWISRSLVTFSEVKVETPGDGGADGRRPGSRGAGQAGQRQGPIVIEGEFKRLDERPVDDPPEDRSRN